MITKHFYLLALKENRVTLMVLIIVDPTISLPPSNYLQDPKVTFSVSAYLGGKCIFRQLYIKFWPNHDNSRQIRCMIYSTSSEALYIDRGRQPSVCEKIYILNHEFICNLNLPTQTFNHKVKGSWINQHCSYINGYSLSLLSENITIVWGRQ